MSGKGYLALAALLSGVGASFIIYSTDGVGEAKRAAVLPASLDPPDFIAPDTYRELATETTQTGDTVRIFTGEAKAGGRSCFGIRQSEMMGAGCWLEPEPVRSSLKAQETTFYGHKMVSGLVTQEVEAVVITNVDGRDVRIPIHNGTFFLDRGSGETVLAYDAAGRVVGGYELEH